MKILWAHNNVCTGYRDISRGFSQQDGGKIPYVVQNIGLNRNHLVTVDENIGKVDNAKGLPILLGASRDGG
jgi:hypothetical protein